MLSILWRASISKGVHYSTVNGAPVLDDLMRHCIVNKTIRINRVSQIKIDNFIKICVFRMVDGTNNISDDVIKSVLSNFAFKRVEAVNGFTWYFLVEGFVVFYVFTIGKNYHDIRRMRLRSQLTSGSHQKIYKLEISKDALLAEIFNDMIVSAKCNPDA